MSSLNQQLWCTYLVNSMEQFERCRKYGSTLLLLLIKKFLFKAKKKKRKINEENSVLTN